jgi:hypothetical protein
VPFAASAFPVKSGLVVIFAKPTLGMYLDKNYSDFQVAMRDLTFSALENKNKNCKINGTVART